jgi:hypothetical protein
MTLAEGSTKVELHVADWHPSPPIPGGQERYCRGGQEESAKSISQPLSPSPRHSLCHSPDPASNSRLQTCKVDRSSPATVNERSKEDSGQGGGEGGGPSSSLLSLLIIVERQTDPRLAKAIFKATKKKTRGRILSLK